MQRGPAFNKTQPRNDKHRLMGSKPREGPVESVEEGLAGLVGRLDLSIP